jgi:hypothetical protein
MRIFNWSHVDNKLSISVVLLFLIVAVGIISYGLYNFL